MALAKLLRMGCTDQSLILRTTWRPCAMRSASGRMQRGVPPPDRQIASARRNSTFQKTLSKRSRFCSRSDQASAQLARRGERLARWFWCLAKTDFACISKVARCGIQRKVRDREKALTNTRDTHARKLCATQTLLCPRPGKSEIPGQAARFRKSSAPFPANQPARIYRRRLQPFALLR